jgi:hypothetical protein
MFTHLRPSLEERARSSRIFLGWRDQWWTDPGTTELQVVGAMGMHEDEPMHRMHPHYVLLLASYIINWISFGFSPGNIKTSVRGVGGWAKNFLNPS